MSMLTKPREHNPVTQFVKEAVAYLPPGDPYAGYFALAGGAWLRCNDLTITEGYDLNIIRNRKGEVAFRDYWSVACYDDGCELSERLKATQGVQG